MHAFMAAALATGVVVAGAIPVTGVGEGGWNKHGELGAFSVEFVDDNAVFTTTEEDAAGVGVDMQLRRGNMLTKLAPISEYADVSIEGKNSALTLEGNFIKDGDKAARYTSIVFFADEAQRDRVLLTWGGAPDEDISAEEFRQRVTDGTYSGNINIERVGWTDSGDKNGEVAYVDEVTVRGETYDFGAPVVPNTIIPVEYEGDEGWKKSGTIDKIEWSPETVTLTDVDGSVDMGLKRNNVLAPSKWTTIEKYRDAEVAGEGAQFAVEGYLTNAAGETKYTSVNFYSDDDQVHLTWGGAHEWISRSEFQARIDSGSLAGMVYSERVGYTDSSETTGHTAVIDFVSFAGTTYDFGATPAAEGEGPLDPVTPEVTPENPDTEIPGPETPDTETPETETPDTETPGTETPGTETPESEGDLPQTGGPGLAAALLGASLLGAGGGLTFLSRRRG